MIIDSAIHLGVGLIQFFQGMREEVLMERMTLKDDGNDEDNSHDFFHILGDLGTFS